MTDGNAATQHDIGEQRTEWSRLDSPPLRLVSFSAADGWPIDGLLYQPEAEPRSEIGIVFVHGKGGNMASGIGRFLPPRLPGITTLSLNMRCHDLAYPTGLAHRPRGGGMWESLREGQLDLEAAVSHLRTIGIEQVFLCGHSSGAFYCADYGARDLGLAGRIFLSPLTDNKYTIPRWFPDPESLASALQLAEEMVERGDGDGLIPLPDWYWAISARSLLERAAEPDDAWFDFVEGSSTPVFMGWGGLEDRSAFWTELFARISVPVKQSRVFPDTEHSLAGAEDDIAASIARFVAQITGAKVKDIVTARDRATNVRGEGK